MSVDQRFDDQIFVDQMSVDQMSVDQMFVDQMSVDQMFVNQIFFGQWLLQPTLLCLVEVGSKGHRRSRKNLQNVSLFSFQKNLKKLFSLKRKIGAGQFGQLAFTSTCLFTMKRKVQAWVRGWEPGGERLGIVAHNAREID
jgi:hypothetical protein